MLFTVLVVVLQNHMLLWSYFYFVTSIVWCEDCSAEQEENSMPAPVYVVHTLFLLRINCVSLLPKIQCNMCGVVK